MTALLEALVDSSLDGILVVDADGQKSRLCSSGKLVLLLDALDQATSPQGLSHWLNRKVGKLVNCPTLVTGRPSTESLPIFAELTEAQLTRVATVLAEAATAATAAKSSTSGDEGRRAA